VGKGWVERPVPFLLPHEKKALDVPRNNNRCGMKCLAENEGHHCGLDFGHTGDHRASWYDYGIHELYWKDEPMQCGAIKDLKQCYLHKGHSGSHIAVWNSNYGRSGMSWSDKPKEINEQPKDNNTVSHKRNICLRK
jgi:hypothetical protein